jgi:putative phosphoribosyl transferase
VQKIALSGSLALPDQPVGAVLFAVHSATDRRDPVRLQIADFLHYAGLATLVASMTTPSEDELEGQLERLAGRVAQGLAWMGRHPRLAGLPLGCFAEGPAVAPALVATSHTEGLMALVIRGGRPELAAAALPRVMAPTLLVVGEHEHDSLIAGRAVLTQLAGPGELAVIDRTSDPVGDPDARGTVCLLARRWFLQYLSPAS